MRFFPLVFAATLGHGQVLCLPGSIDAQQKELEAARRAEKDQERLARAEARASVDRDGEWLAAEKAVATEPSLAKGHARRGEALLAMERYRDAAFAFSMALDRQESPEYAALRAKALEMSATAG